MSLRRNRTVFSKHIPVVFFIAVSLSIFGQNETKIDSVYRLYHSALRNKDTVAADVQMKWLKSQNDTPVLEFFLQLAKADLAMQKENKQEVFFSCNRAREIAMKLKCDSLIFRANFRTGSFYMDLSDLISALSCFNRCLLQLGAVKNVNDKIYLYRDIALIYSYLDKNELSIQNFLKIEPLAKQANNKKIVGNVYNNIGVNYMRLKNLSKALYYYRNSLALRLEIKDDHGIAQVNNNLGSVYYESKEYKEALEYFLKGRELRQKANVEVQGLIESDINIGKTYNKLKQTDKALKFLEEGRAGAIKVANIELERRADEELLKIYSGLGDFKKALELQSRYFLLKDSLYGLNKKEEIGRLSFESKMRTDSLTFSEEQKKETAVHQEQEKRSALVRNISVGGFLSVLLIAFVLYKQVKRIRLANEIIAEQKDQIETKQKELLDSINYAKHIQQSLMPTETYIERTLNRLPLKGKEHKA
jgi:tetratricopeptide (TPR) repeat protein